MEVRERRRTSWTNSQMGIMWLFWEQSLEAVALGVRGKDAKDEVSVDGEIGDGSWRLRMCR